MVMGLGPPLPAEATTTMPAFQAFMMAWLSGSCQYHECTGALNEQLRTRML